MNLITDLSDTWDRNIGYDNHPLDITTNVNNMESGRLILFKHWRSSTLQQESISSKIYRAVEQTLEQN